MWHRVKVVAAEVLWRVIVTVAVTFFVLALLSIIFAQKFLELVKQGAL